MKNIIGQFLEDVTKLRVLVIGDVMLDAYLWGLAERISPEAPVPVVHIQSKEYRLGGAANVALNIQSLGATVQLVSHIGNDVEASIFEDLLSKRGLGNAGLVKSNVKPTTVKNRILSQNHQMLRFDVEDSRPVNEEITERLFQKVAGLIDSVDAVVFQDYDKGILTQPLIEKIVALCQSRNIPVTVDPKKRNFLSYKGVTLFKPNLKEIKEGLNIDFDEDDHEALQSAVSQLMSVLGNEITFLTLASKGIYVKTKEATELIPAYTRSVADVSGAGDTVIAIAALGLALNINLPDIARISNIAAGLVCQEVGVVPVSRNGLKKIKVDKKELVGDFNAGNPSFKS